MKRIMLVCLTALAVSGTALYMPNLPEVISWSVTKPV